MSWIKKKKIVSLIAMTSVSTLLIISALEAITSIAYYQKNRSGHLSLSSTVGTMQFLLSKFYWKSATPRLDRITILRKKGIEAYPNYLFEPQIHDPDDFYHLANVPESYIVDCAEGGPFSEWHSDEIGFRNPLGQLGSKVDFLFIGDSFTEGACESEASTFAGVFRKNGLKVMNLGRSGAGPLFNYATLVEYGTAVNAKNVLWIVFTGNDLHNLREEKTTKLSLYLKDNYQQGLLKKKHTVGKNLKLFLNMEIERTQERIQKGMVVPRNIGYGESLDSIDAHAKERSLLLNVASKIKKSVDKHGAKLSIVILNHPNYDPLIQEITSDTIKKFSIDNKIPYVEYSRAYLTDNFRGLYTPSMGHFNGKGYRQIGEDIFNKFVTK